MGHFCKKIVAKNIQKTPDLVTLLGSAIKVGRNHIPHLNIFYSFSSCRDWVVLANNGPRLKQLVNSIINFKEYIRGNRYKNEEMNECVVSESLESLHFKLCSN